MWWWNLSTANGSLWKPSSLPTNEWIRRRREHRFTGRRFTDGKRWITGQLRSISRNTMHRFTKLQHSTPTWGTPFPEFPSTVWPGQQQLQWCAEQTKWPRRTNQKLHVPAERNNQCPSVYETWFSRTWFTADVIGSSRCGYPTRQWTAHKLNLKWNNELIILLLTLRDSYNNEEST